MAIELEIFEASTREFGKCSEKFNLLSGFHNRLLCMLYNLSNIFEMIFLVRKVLRQKYLHTRYFNIKERRWGGGESNI